jgi:hypothetical protein
MRQVRTQIGHGNLMFVRISYGVAFALSLAFGFYIGEVKWFIIVAITATVMIAVPLRLTKYIFIKPDGFLIESVIGSKKQFDFKMYNGIENADVMSRITGNYLVIRFSDGSYFEFLSTKDQNAMDKEVRELILSYSTQSGVTSDVV